ncbi:acyl-CoA dehydrogenase family protein [Lentzea kentuckyensis]|uniref:acyl-CoA dehydrogenase family protein n=1 Tax=Lentzea kentuckyensis TaxID=360086 RepID=UPI000A36CF1C|nr:acyl-CoA dehydrogenase family protein [Lentzea kentuckyensis]
MSATLNGPEATRYPAGAELDHRLGDPRADENPYGFAAMRQRDEHADLTALADEAGTDLRLAFVPQCFGGELRTADDTLMSARLASRRDGTAMPATMFGITATTCVLLAGTPEQCAEVVTMARHGQTTGFALIEEEHDGDLLAGDCSLFDDGRGDYRLTGRKWRVGLGPECSALLVLARTGGRGPAAFTLVLLRDQDLANAKRNVHRTEGFRGIEFADFCFDNLLVPAQDVVGGIGQGMETVLRALQLVRAMSTAANLGCADTALRLTMDHATTARFEGAPLTAMPYVRRELGASAAALTVADVVATACARGLHTLPGQQSLWSSVAKAVVTDLSEDVFARCADVLAFRGQLADGPTGAFGVARRDNAVVRYIDIDPIGNLRLTAQQLRRFAAHDVLDQPPPSTELMTAFSLDAPLPELRLSDLALSWRGRDDVTAALPAVSHEIRDLLAGAPSAGPLLGRLGSLQAALSLVPREVQELSTLLGKECGRSAELLDLAERFTLLHAAASCVHLWWFNRHRPLFGQPPGSTGWLVAALDVLRDRGRGPRGRLEPEIAAAPFVLAEALHAEGRLFSAAPVLLREGAS